MQVSANQDEAVEISDPSLDFTSPSFDALKVLHTDPCKLQLPFPSVQPCDNLDAYESGKTTDKLARCVGRCVSTVLARL